MENTRKQNESLLIEKLEEIKVIYQAKALESDGIQKTMYDNLSEGIQYLVDAHKSNYVLKDEMLKDIDKKNELQEGIGEMIQSLKENNNPIVMGFYSISSIYMNSYKPEKSSKSTGIINGLGGLATMDLDDKTALSLPPEFLAEILYINAVDVRFSENGLRGKEEYEALKQTIEESLSFEPLGISYLSPEMKQALVDVKAGTKEQNEFPDWQHLFDFQSKFNSALTVCKQVEVALKYSYDPNVESFIKKSLEGNSKTIEALKLNNSAKSELLKNQIQSAIAKIEETQKACTPEKLEEQAILGISELSKKLSEKDTDQIAFKVYKQLKKENKLDGIGSLNLDNPSELKKLLDKVKVRAKHSKESSMPDLGIMDFLSTVYYAIVDLFKNKEQVKTKTVLGKYTKSIIEAKANNHPALAA